jgi:hypothetical protein
VECNACGQAKAKQKEYRYLRDLRDLKSRERIVVDFHDFLKDHEGFDSIGSSQRLTL